MSLTQILGLLLALSALLNVMVGRNYLEARDAATQAESARLQASAAATLCSASIEGMEAAAAERAREATRFRAKAESNARTHQVRAHRILATPPSTPGDACKSAADRVDAWLIERRGKP